MKKTTAKRFSALVVGLSLLAAACGSDDAATEETTAVAEEAAPAASGGELAGMKGTTPLVELTQEFKDAVNAFWTGKATKHLLTSTTQQNHLTL